MRDPFFTTTSINRLAKIHTKTAPKATMYNNLRLDISFKEYESINERRAICVFKLVSMSSESSFFINCDSVYSLTTLVSYTAANLSSSGCFSFAATLTFYLSTTGSGLSLPAACYFYFLAPIF